MDANEATKMVFARIQNLDLENVSKIMGYLLLQDYGEKEMIRLAFGPENLLHNLILQAKTQLGLSSSNTPPTPLSSPFIPASRPSSLSISSPRLINNRINGFESIANPSSPSTNSWPFLSPKSSSTPSYAGVVNGASNDNAGSTPLSSTGSLPSGFACHFNNNHSTSSSTCTNDLIDDYQLQDHLSFLNDSKTNDLFDPRSELVMSPTAYAGDNGLHKRSFSVPGMCFGPEDVNSGLGWKPCLYFSKGFCKNGTTCRFVHGGDSADGGAPMVGSPSEFNEFEQCQELLRSKAAAFQQQKLAEASMFMTGADFSPYNKYMNFVHQQNDTQRSATFMRGDELYRFGRCRPERNDFSQLGLGGAMSPSSRQIYLTFPADSTFREEDVSNYFSIYGPVQDVRIPYQQKRMFGFVTFLYPETVKRILAKGNPHFVCDSRVLVKPYKEKGKIPDKKQLQLQQTEREDYSACPSPSGLNPRESFDHLHVGARMFCNTQEILLRRKLEEQAGLQQALELQGRRLLNLQLLDVKNHNRYHQHRYLHGLSAGSPIHSPILPHNPNNQTLIFPIDGIDQEVPKENGGNPDTPVPQNAVADADQKVNPACNSNDGNNRNNGMEEKSNNEDCDLQENLEHILPDNLFASPKKADGEQLTVFSTASVQVDENTLSPITSSSNSNPLVPTSLNVNSLKSCFRQMPSLSSGHEAIGM